ncbi:hypothetical protein V5J35_004485 [Endozoicomonas sp. NE40]|uniref:Uncharacterized protein n=1 Tax=Endozoicomonas lisbonensis TaxID=3120522 RepID=A0ABV2SNF0_9GAMM
MQMHIFGWPLPPLEITGLSERPQLVYPMLLHANMQALHTVHHFRFMAFKTLLTVD